MSRICELTGKGPTTGNSVSHSNIKTRTRWLPNLQRKKYMIPELSETVTFLLSTHAIRTIDKQGGLTPALMKAKVEGLSDSMLKIRHRILKSRRSK